MTSRESEDQSQNADQSILQPREYPSVSSVRDRPSIVPPVNPSLSFLRNLITPLSQVIHHNQCLPLDPATPTQEPNSPFVARTSHSSIRPMLKYGPPPRLSNGPAACHCGHHLSLQRSRCLLCAYFYGISHYLTSHAAAQRWSHAVTSTILSSQLRLLALSIQPLVG